MLEPVFVRRLLLTICTAIAAASFALAAPAAVPATLSFSIAKAPHPLALDPTLSDPAWQAGKVPEPGPWENITRRAPAAHATIAYLLYDEHNLYIGFEAEQSGTPIVATQSTNDVGFGLDDFVGVGIDTGSGGSQTYYFETTPAGVRYQQASENARYRPRWRAAATRKGGNWSAVMIVPLRVLRTSQGTQSWHVNFVRGVAAVAEHYTWAYAGLMQDGGNGWPTFADEQFWPKVEGIKLGLDTANRPKPRAEIYGLESLGNDRNLFQQADGSFLPQRVRPLGVDVSYPVTPTINFVGTLDPDFSNVEIDQQTIAPQEFRRQLHEYRPFFSQGAAFINPAIDPYSNFNGPENLVFYSPGVGPFDRGEKLEGTFGKQSFGVLNFRGYDQTSGNTFDDIAYGYKHALQDQTFAYYTDGVFAHHSVAGSDATVEYGVKGRNLHNGFVYNFNGAFERGTWVPGGIAHSADAFLDVHKTYHETLFGYVDISPNYNPIDGFTSNSDIHGFQGFQAFNGSTRFAKSWNIFLVGDRFFDRSGALHEVDSSATLSATFNNGFSIDGAGTSVGLLRSYDVTAKNDCTGPTVGRSSFTGFPCYRNGETDPFNLAFIPIGYRDGTPTPIDVSAQWGNFYPNYVHLYTATTSHPIGKRLTLGLEYDGTFQRTLATGAVDSQWLRRISLGIDTGRNSNFTLSLRDINGLGGFAAQQGLNVAAGYHIALPSGDLYINYGTPAASYTLERFIVKYVFRAGADAGT